MRLPRLPGSGPVYRLRPGVTEDSYGDPVESWDAPERTAIPGAHLQVQDSTEAPGGGRVRVITRAVLYAPGHVDLTEDDRVEHGGQVLLVDGAPAPHRGLSGPVYTSAALKRPTG